MGSLLDSENRVARERLYGEEVRRRRSADAVGVGAVDGVELEREYIVVVAAREG